MRGAPLGRTPFSYEYTTYRPPVKTVCHLFHIQITCARTSSPYVTCEPNWYAGSQRTEAKT